MSQFLCPHCEQVRLTIDDAAIEQHLATNPSQLFGCPHCGSRLQFDGLQVRVQEARNADLDRERDAREARYQGLVPYAREYPQGTIGILSGDLTRWAWFFQSFLSLQRPNDTNIEWVIGSWVGSAVNMLVDAMRPEDEFLSIHADDHIFEPDALLRLLRHTVPLVAPVVCLRRLPYYPSIFHETEAGFVGYTWEELDGQSGLIPVDSFGGPGCVIRREVFEAVGTPFFENMPGRRTAPNEDLYAFSKCRKAGFQPYIDLDCVFGHCIPAAVFPHRSSEGQRGVRLWSFTDLGLVFPRAAPPLTGEQHHTYT